MLGYTVEGAASGREARRMVGSQGFDIVLCDVLLPDAEGIALTAEFVRDNPKLRVVLMSGYAQTDALRRVLSEGRARFLQKPFRVDALARELGLARPFPGSPSAES